MNVSDALKQRKSIRAFLDKPVSLELVKTLLEMAKWAPSGVNMQPWDVCVVQGSSKKELEEKVIKAYDADTKEAMDYAYYPALWEEPYKSRRKETGLLMYQTLGISREDKERQRAQWKANYRAFDAPVVLYFFIDKALEKGSYLDYGMFLQSIMLGALELGLSTCPQAALAEFPQTVKTFLGVDESKVLLCGIALGYEDKTALINSYKTSRIDLESFVRFYA